MTFGKTRFDALQPRLFFFYAKYFCVASRRSNIDCKISRQKKRGWTWTKWKGRRRRKRKKTSISFVGTRGRRSRLAQNLHGVLASTQQKTELLLLLLLCCCCREKDREGGWFFIMPIYFFFLVPSTFLPSLVVNCRAIVYDPRSLFLLALRSRRGSHLDSRPQLHTRSCQYLTFQRPADRVAHQTLAVRTVPVEYKVHGARTQDRKSVV